MKQIFYLIYLLFLIYIVWVFPSEAKTEVMINLVPFHTIQLYVTAFIHGYAPIYIIIGNLVGNIVLFIPIGILLFSYFRYLGIGIILFFSFYIPVYIELVQYLLHIAGYRTRTIDIDDVLLNMFGIWIGYLVVAIAKRIQIR